jgi:hypothetical protein
MVFITVIILIKKNIFFILIIIEIKLKNGRKKFKIKKKYFIKFTNN